jgi:hypothetical protein
MSFLSSGLEQIQHLPDTNVFCVLREILSDDTTFIVHTRSVCPVKAAELAQYTE